MELGATWPSEGGGNGKSFKGLSNTDQAVVLSGSHICQVKTSEIAE